MGQAVQNKSYVRLKYIISPYEYWWWGSRVAEATIAILTLRGGIQGERVSRIGVELSGGRCGVWGALFRVHSRPPVLT